METISIFPDHVMLEVTDKIRKALFLLNRYYHVGNKGSKYTGLGIGLFICAEIYQRHEGETGV